MKHLIKIRQSIYIGFILTLSSCSYYDDKVPRNTVSAEPPVEKPLTPAPTSEKAQPKFSWIFANIIQNKCLKCHSGANPKAEIDLSNYESVMKSDGVKFKAVSINRPEESGLFSEIRNKKMPPKTPKCSNEEIQAIYEWILNGAENN